MAVAPLRPVEDRVEKSDRVERMDDRTPKEDKERIKAVVDEITRAALPDCGRPIGKGERRPKRNRGAT